MENIVEQVSGNYNGLSSKIESSHLGCKTVNNCLNVREWVEMRGKNMGSSLPQLSCVSANKILDKKLNYCKIFMSKFPLRLNLWYCKKKSTSPSSTFVIKAMMIPHINIKNLWKFRSGNSIMEKDTKDHFFRLYSKN